MARQATRNNAPPPDKSPRPASAAGLLTTEELAAYIGGDLSARTIETWRRLGKGPDPVHLGPKTVRYRLSAVERWLDSLERDTAARVA